MAERERAAELAALAAELDLSLQPFRKETRRPPRHTHGDRCPHELWMVEGELQDDLRTHGEPNHEHGWLADGRDKRGAVRGVVFDSPRGRTAADGRSRTARVE